MPRPNIYRPAKIKKTRDKITAEGIDNYIKNRWPTMLGQISERITDEQNNGLGKEVSVK